MSTQLVCDIIDCFGEASSHQVILLDVAREPADYYNWTSYEKTGVDTVDLCKEHYDKFRSKVANIMVRDEKGLYFPT